MLRNTVLGGNVSLTSSKLSFLKSCEIGVKIFQMRKMRFREVKLFAQGHIEDKWPRGNAIQSSYSRSCILSYSVSAVGIWTAAVTDKQANLGFWIKNWIKDNYLLNHHQLLQSCGRKKAIKLMVLYTHPFSFSNLWICHMFPMNVAVSLRERFLWS